MSNRSQMKLPLNLPTMPPKRKRGSSGQSAWYYIVNGRNDEMLAVDEKGRYVWIEHDTLRLKPNLFNVRSVANMVANKRGGHVRKWKWRVT